MTTCTTLSRIGTCWRESGFERRESEDSIHYAIHYISDSASREGNAVDNLKDALDYIENEPTIFRYAWFSGRTTAIANVDLLAGAGALTTLGGDYVSLPEPGGVLPVSG